MWRHNDDAEPAMCCRVARRFHGISVSCNELLECPRKSLHKIEASNTHRPSLLRDTVARHWVACAWRFERLLISYLRVKCHSIFDIRLLKMPDLLREHIDPIFKSRMSHNIWLFQVRPVWCLETSTFHSHGDAAPHLERTKILTVPLWKPKIWML